MSNDAKNHLREKMKPIMLGQVNEVKEMDDKVLIPLSPMDERSTHFFATIISDLVKLGYEQKDIERHYKDFLKANKLKDILAYVEDRGRMIWQGERTTIVVG